jgi:hypothetical protein
LALAVLALHALAWLAAAGGLPWFAPAPAGVHRAAPASLPQRAVRLAQARSVPDPKPVQMAAPAAAAEQAFPPPPRAPLRGRAAPGQRAAVPASPPPRAGNSGPRHRAAPAAPQWPVYPTRPPPPAMLRYALVQSGVASAAAGSAALEWQRDARSFSLRLATAVDGRPQREWQSTGTFDAAGLAPLRLVERERGRDRRALGFDREAGQVHFAGAQGVAAIARGAQDRWSWIAQLAAIAEAQASRGVRPDHWDMQVAGLRGSLERWTFRVLPPDDPPPELQGNDVSTQEHRAPDLLHVLRATEQPYDLRIEAWLSPSLHHLPAGLRMSTPPGPWSLSLWLRRP